MLQPSDCVYSESLTPQGRLVACHRDLTEILVCEYSFVFMNLFFCDIDYKSKGVPLLSPGIVSGSTTAICYSPLAESDMKMFLMHITVPLE